MSPQRQLSNFIDSFLLNYVFPSDSEMSEVKPTIIDEYRKLNEKCDCIISRINRRKNKLLTAA
jgi:hypothetical protein